MLYLFNLGFGEWQDRLGQAAAVGWIFAFIILVISLLNFLLTRSISSSGEPRTRARRSRRPAPVSSDQDTPSAPADELIEDELIEGVRR
jgi:cellobiose transport system permease protein